MRMIGAGFGLLSLLVGAAIIFWISFGGSNGGEVGATLKAGKDAREQTSQISGRTEDDVPIADTIKLDEVNDSNGQFKRLKVISITPGTPMETAYGLKVDDQITKVGDMGVNDNNDAGLARALVIEAYQRNEPLVVLRNDVEMKLTPNTALTHFHPNIFGAPGTTVTNPTPPPTVQQIPMH